MTDCVLRATDIRYLPHPLDLETDLDPSAEKGGRTWAQAPARGATRVTMVGLRPPSFNPLR